MKGLNFQCLYDIDESRILFTAFNRDGSLCGFENPPVRNFDLGVWVDSVTGGYGELQQFERWDVSMREPSEMSDRRKANLQKGKKIPYVSYGGRSGKKMLKREENKIQ